MVPHFPVAIPPRLSPLLVLPRQSWRWAGGSGHCFSLGKVWSPNTPPSAASGNLPEGAPTQDPPPSSCFFDGTLPRWPRYPQGASRASHLQTPPGPAPASTDWLLRAVPLPSCERPPSQKRQPEPGPRGRARPLWWMQLGAREWGHSPLHRNPPRCPLPVLGPSTQRCLRLQTPAGGRGAGQGWGDP